MNGRTLSTSPVARALIAAAVLACAMPWARAQAPASPLADNLTPSQLEGRQLYGVHCVYCHGAGPGRAGTAALARRMGQDRSLLEARVDLDRAYVQYVVRHGLNAMLPLRRTELTDAELGHVIDWLQRPRATQAPAGGQR